MSAAEITFTRPERRKNLRWERKTDTVDHSQRRDETATRARRSTSAGWLFGLLLPALAVFPASAELLQTNKVLYTVANSHLDTQWNWTIQSTIYPYLSNTLYGNFAHFTNYPSYVFNFEGAFRYRLMREYYPEEYETLKHYIAAGRWRVAGSVVDAGDVIVPSPESLFRQILYGNRLYQQELGKTSTDIFLPDCFGFPYSLPSIAAHSGLKGFSTAKLRWGSAIPFPFQNIGRWIGPDGASVIAVIEPGAYDSAITENLATSTNYLGRIERMAGATGLNVDFRYFGTGDIGGAPNPAYVDWLEKSIALGGPIKVLSAGADDLFRDLTPEQVNRLPTYQGELLMRVHGVGCYTSHSEMKTYNRRNELWGDAAERAAVIADWLQGGGTYPQERLTKAWERFLWHQFHDDLTGTSIDAAYNFSWNDELLSLKDFASEQTLVVGVLAQALDTTAAGMPLVVFNPLATEREDVVEAEVNFTHSAPQAVRVFGPDGAEVPSQTGPVRGNVLPVTFLARVPATGAAVFEVRPAESPSALSNALSVSPSHLENTRYRVQLDANGDVSSIFDKTNQRELLRAPIRWHFLYNLSTAWPAWEITYAAVTGTPTYLGGPAKVEILERGPARVSVAMTRFKDGSAFTERIRLGAGAAGDFVEWDVSVNWHTRNTLLKVAFPLSVSNPTASYDLGLGTIERGNASPSLWEVPAQQWADLTDASGIYGVSIVNDSKYGWDKPNDHTLRLTIFHTPEAAGNYPHGAYNSIGSHRLRFAVMGHANDWRAGQSPWAAARLNQPLQAFQTTAHPGTLGKSFSFLACDNPNVMVKALKKAEDSEEIVVRLHELSGRAQTAQLTFAAPIAAAREMNGAEAPLGPLTPVDGKLKVALSPYQPRTLAMTLAAPNQLVPKTESTPVALLFNLDGVSRDANRTDGNFDAGFTYPAELMPAEIVRGGVKFLTGPTNDGVLNVVACQGQTIELNAGGHTQLHFLAAAAGADTAATFTVDGRATGLNIQHFTGYVGQWNPPQLKPAEVAWVFTHRHTPAGNDPYRFCYLFQYRLDLPPNAKTLTLPNQPNVRIFALSLARTPAGTTTVAGGPLGANEIPWADAGADQTVNASADGKARVTLDATRSGDADGRFVSYVWSLNGRVLATGANPVVALGLGTNAVLLTVTDDRHDTSQDMVTIIVQPPLTVTLSTSTDHAGAAPLAVQFTGSASGGSEAPVNMAAEVAGLVTAQGEFAPNETAVRAFDGRPDTKWLDHARANPSTRASWLQFQYPAGARPLVTGYALTSANDAPARDPRDWRLLGSNDGTNWTVLDRRTNQAFATRAERREFELTKGEGFNRYRLAIDCILDPGAASAVQLAELELIGVPDYAFAWNLGDGTVVTGREVRHTYTNQGNFPVTLAVAQGRLSGTSQTVITVGTPLSASIHAMPAGHAGTMFQFEAVVAGGNPARSPYNTPADGLGRIFAQGENAPAEGKARVFDNDPRTKWLDFTTVYPNTQSSWLEYRYANDWPHVLTRYALTSANDFPGRDPRDWRLLGSPDGTNWITLDVRTNQVFSARFERREFLISEMTACRRYRLQIDTVLQPATAGCVQLAELELIGTPVYTYSWTFSDGATATVPDPRHTFTGRRPFAATLIVSDGVARATNSLVVPAHARR